MLRSVVMALKPCLQIEIPGSLPVMRLEVGYVVGDYEVLGVLGAGSMGQVFRVRNTLSDRIEAMKVLKPTLLAEPETAARFMAEIRTLAGFTHPNIAQLRTALQIDNQLVMIMELVEGQPLQCQIRGGVVPQQRALRYVLQLLSALSYAHRRGVIHRDIKPANLMVTSQGLVKLMDFGVAKSEARGPLTRPGVAVGSLRYMSPEQMRGCAVDNRSDLYSVGILLYELLTGRKPFEANRVRSLVRHQTDLPPRAPIEINPLLPKSLNDLILCSLAKDPAKRFQSADSMARALSGFTLQPPRREREAAAVVASRHQSPADGRPKVLHEAAPPSGRATAVVSPPRSAFTAGATTGRSGLLIRHSPFWVRLGWVAVGACAVILVCSAALELPGFLNRTKSGGADSRLSVDSLPDTEANTENDMARERQQMVQLQARTDALQVRLARQPHGGGNTDASELDRQYAHIRGHLRTAENDLKNRNSIAAGREMETAQTEISALESNLGQ